MGHCVRDVYLHVSLAVLRAKLSMTELKYTQDPCFRIQMEFYGEIDN